MKKIAIEVFLNETEILGWMHRYHYEQNDWIRIIGVYHNIISVMCSGIYVKHAAKEKKDGKERLSFLKEEEYVLVMATLGEGVDMLLEQYHGRGEIWKEYAVECLSMELLRKLYEKAEIEIFKISGQYPVNYNFVGEDGSMEDIMEVFSYLRQDEIIYNEAYALFPSKSVIFTTALQANKGESTCMICMNCKNLSCKERREESLHYGYQRIFSKANR